VVALILFVQQIRNYYGDDIELAWSWFSTNFVPTLSLMVAVLVSAQHETDATRRMVDRSFYWTTLAVSSVFLLLLLATVLVQPIAVRSPLELMQGSTWYLTPFQGLATGMLGAFFIRKDK
jgi:hypothetical protein